MQKAVRNKGRRPHILQKKSLHLRKRESLGKFCSRTKVLSLLKTGPLESAKR